MKTPNTKKNQRLTLMGKDIQHSNGQSQSKGITKYSRKFARDLGYRRGPVQ